MSAGQPGANHAKAQCVMDINMKTPRIEEIVDEVASVCDEVEFLHGVPVKLPSQTKALLRGRVREALTAARNAGIDEAVEKVMPFLKAYKQSLDSDWEVNPVQATPLVYCSPESVLRDKADAIEAKRKMVKALDDTIKTLQNNK